MLLVLQVVVLLRVIVWMSEGGSCGCGSCGRRELLSLLLLL